MIQPVDSAIFVSSVLPIQHFRGYGEGPGKTLSRDQEENWIKFREVNIGFQTKFECEGAKIHFDNGGF